MTTEKQEIRTKKLQGKHKQNLKEKPNILDLHTRILGLSGVCLMELPLSLVRSAH